MTTLVTISTALPKFEANSDAVEAAAKVWLDGDSPEFELFQRFLQASRTRTRYFTRPPGEIIELEGARSRAAFFEREGVRLACEAAHHALEESNLRADEIDALIFTSCSVPLIPSADTYLVDRLGMHPDVLRLPAYQFGCAGGVLGLGFAHRLGHAYRHALLVSSEVCSLLFQRKNRSPSQLVGAAIFGDGAAAAVLSNSLEGRARIVAHRSHLLPESRHLMGYDIEDNGNHLRLDRELPSHLVHEVPRIVDEFLKQNSLTRKDIPYWLFHPGGTKILASLQEVFELSESQCGWAGEVLSSVGNLSSATILFVISRFLESRTARSGERALVVGIGPGLTVENVLLEIL